MYYVFININYYAVTCKSVIFSKIARKSTARSQHYDKTMHFCVPLHRRNSEGSRVRMYPLRPLQFHVVALRTNILATPRTRKKSTLAILAP